MTWFLLSKSRDFWDVNSTWIPQQIVGLFDDAKSREIAEEFLLNLTPNLRVNYADFKITCLAVIMFGVQLHVMGGNFTEKSQSWVGAVNTGLFHVQFQN